MHDTSTTRNLSCSGARKLAPHQVIGLSSGENTRHRCRGPGGVGPAMSDRENGDHGSSSGFGTTIRASGPEGEDPEVIIARRNAEHRRMQVTLRRRTNQSCERHPDSGNLNTHVYVFFERRFSRQRDHWLTTRMRISVVESGTPGKLTLSYMTGGETS